MTYLFLPVPWSGIPIIKHEGLKKKNRMDVLFSRSYFVSKKPAAAKWLWRAYNLHAGRSLRKFVLTYDIKFRRPGLIGRTVLTVLKAYFYFCL